MHERKSVAWVGFVLLAVAGAPAMAQDAAFYVGGHLASADYGGGDRDTGWGVVAGYEFNPNYALEVGYSDLGQVGDAVPGIGSASAAATVYELSGIGAFEVTDRLSMHGRLGAYRGEVTFRTHLVGLPPFSDRQSHTDFTYGFGVRFDLRSNFALRGTWQRYSDVGDVADIDALSVAFLVRF